MPRIKLKKLLLEEGIKRQQAVINDFQARIKDLLANESNVNEEEFDPSVQAFNAGTTKEVHLITEQLHVANTELEELFKMQSFANIMHHRAERGAIVLTNNGNFFISGSHRSFEVNGDEYIFLSVKSPMFHAMEGKKEGEGFDFRKTEYKIKEVF